MSAEDNAFLHRWRLPGGWLEGLGSAIPRPQLAWEDIPEQQIHPRGESLTEPYDRRAFLHRLAHRVATVGLAAPTVSTLGCSLEEIQREAEDVGPAGLSITRPLLFPWTDGAVRIGAPLSKSPAAYVSRGPQKVYIELESRFEIRMVLAAHISVSSGHWRIPLRGDDLAIPIDAGDELREFEERPIGEWDPTMEPTEGDFRIRRGRREKVRVAFDCFPMAKSEGWFSAGPWDIEQCVAGPETDLCREEFMTIGTGTRYTRRPLGACGEPAGTVRYLTWACPDT